MDRKCTSCNKSFDEVLVRCPYCGTIPSKTSEIDLTPLQIRIISKHVRKELLKTTLFWFGIISLVIGIGLWQVYQGATKQIQDILVQRISEEFEQPKINKTIQDVASSDAQRIIRDEIQPEVVRFRSQIESDTQELKDFVQSAQNRSDDIAANLSTLEQQTQRRIEDLQNRPNFHQEMFSMISGISSSIFRDYHKALDYYEIEDYENTLKTIHQVTRDYENGKPWNLKNYSVKEHNKWASEFYLLASKTSVRLHKNDLAYEYSQKAKDINPTHYTYYSIAVAAYNLRNYDESLEMINKALELNPPDSSVSIYQKIRGKSLNHINDQK